MKLGYARVSTDEQSLAVQLEQLKSAGCDRIHCEKQSGKSTAYRLELDRLMQYLETPRRPGEVDTVIVTKLDRLARSTADLLAIVARIGKAGASFVSLAEPWADTTSPAGTLIMTVFAGVAQFELERMKERCAAGRARARRDGVKFGRSKVLSRHKEHLALAALKGGATPREVAHDLQVSRSTVYRLKKQAGA